MSAAVPQGQMPTVEELRDRYDLNERMARFVLELAATGFNQTKAAKRAGYAEGSAHATGSRLMKNDKVEAALEEVTRPLTREAELRAERLLEEYRRIALSSIADVVSWDEEGRVTVRPTEELPREVLAAVKKIKHREHVSEDGSTRRTLEIQMHEKSKAMEKLGQYLGLWKDPNELRVRVLQVFAEMSPDELRRVEEMDDDELVELLEDGGTWKAPDADR